MTGSWQDGADVDEDALQLGQELGKGGQGLVRRVLGQQASVAFKQYIVPGADPAALRTLVDLPAALDPADRVSLLARTAWPLARVNRRGALSGFLMQLIPSEFIAPNSVGVMKLRELQYLLYAPKPLWGDIVPPGISMATRIGVATEFARLMRLLHSKALVLGDVSMLNVLWAPGDPARIFLIDCDGVRKAGGKPVLPQAETPDWDDPRQPKSGPDLDTDRYKLALLIGRVLAAQPKIRPETHSLDLPPDVPPATAARLLPLWKQAAGSWGQRPNAAQWLMAFEGRIEIPVAPPPAVRQPPAIPRAEMEGSGQRPEIKVYPPDSPNR